MNDNQTRVLAIIATTKTPLYQLLTLRSSIFERFSCCGVLVDRRPLVSDTHKDGASDDAVDGVTQHLVSLQALLLDQLFEGRYPQHFRLGHGFDTDSAQESNRLNLVDDLPHSPAGDELEPANRRLMGSLGNLLLDILDPTPQTVDALMKLELSAGVDVEIKL